MTFPATPANGDLFQINGYTYTYVSTQNQWVGTMPTSGSVSSSSGSFAPTNAFSLKLDISLATAAHQGGVAQHLTGLPAAETIVLIKDFDFQANDSFIQVYESIGKFGSDIEAVGQAQAVDPSIPRFDTVAEFLASSPTYNVNGFAAFFSDAAGSYFFTNDSGANFTESPNPFVGTGSVRFNKAGKYRVRIVDSSVIQDTTSGAAIQGVQGLLKNDEMINLEFFKAKYEEVSANSQGFTTNLDYSVIVDVVSGDEISLALAKYSGAAARSEHLIDMKIESLF